MRVYAHRGWREVYPENTMLAFRKAVEIGAHGIEFDVHLTKDGQIIIIHDERLDRTTNGVGRVKDYTIKELREFNAAINYPEFETETVPTLREYMEFIRSKDIITNIELKNSIYPYEAIEEKVYRLVREFELESKVIVSSFNHQSLYDFKKMAPEISTALLTSEWIVDPVTYCENLGVSYFHPSCYMIKADDVRALQNSGVAVNVWFGQEPFSLEKIVALHPDGVIHDNVEEALRITERRSSI